MNTVIWTAVAIVALLANIAAHEISHGLALRGFGIPTVEAGFGMPLGPQWVWKKNGRREFDLTVSLVLLGAYVKPDPEKLEEWEKTASYWDQAWYLTAGVIINMITGFGLLALYGYSRGSFIAPTIVAMGAVVFWVLRRWIAAYVVPFVGVLAIALLIWQFATVPITTAQGPIVGVFNLLVSSDWRYALLTSGLIALSIGIVNCAPLVPLDGGHVIVAALKAMKAKHNTILAFKAVGMLLTLALVGYMLLTDALSLIVRL